MIYAAPGATFEARVEGFPTGLAGTVGVRLLDNVGGTTTARVTAGITENPAGSGSYVVTLTAPATAGQYSVFWDDGTVSPSTTAAEDVTVTAASVTTTTATGTWSYDPTQLATSELYRVRFEISDTDSTAPLLVDAEVNQAISVELNQWGAAARCCEIISRNFLRKADVRVGRGGTQVTYSSAAKQYADMAVALRKKASALHAPWTGGTLIADKDSLAADSSLVQPMFTKKMEDNPYVGGQGSNTPTKDGQ